jgi:hypothetical protein
MPCPYANILGVPGEGVHAARIFGLARNDIIATILVAALTSYIIRYKNTENWTNDIYKAFFSSTFVYSFAAWFLLAEILHYSFGTNTAFLKLIHMSPKC